MKIGKICDVWYWLRWKYEVKSTFVGLLSAPFCDAEVGLVVITVVGFVWIAAVLGYQIRSNQN